MPLASEDEIQEVDQFFWEDGYPSNDGDAVVMDSVGRKLHGWVDRHQDQTHHVICEIGELTEGENLNLIISDRTIIIVYFRCAQFTL